MQALIKKVKEREEDIRDLFTRQGRDLIQVESEADEDVRIADIKSCSGKKTLEMKFRRVLAFRSLLREDRKRQQARINTAKDPTEKYNYSEANKIFKYEELSVSTTCVVFVFCWSHALRTTDVSGFIDVLEKENSSLYNLFKERADWFEDCQSLYDGKFRPRLYCNRLTVLAQCGARNKNSHVPLVFCNSQPCNKRKRSREEDQEGRSSPPRGKCKDGAQRMEGATEQRALSTASQGPRTVHIFK